MFTITTTASQYTAEKLSNTGVTINRTGRHRTRENHTKIT